ncbi:hypothetical protein [Photobacterium leiognathi]|uniref:hypothetical protein n=1 Tax=Photobacterium leiognathi TaxID=553611 RepID=UPI0029824866|nr:hypothetical protein [Photobacterium leiognathi]
MTVLKEDLDYFINCLNELMKDKLIIQITDSHPYQNQVSNIRKFAENLIKAYGMDYVKVVENLTDHINSDVICISNNTEMSNQLNIYQQLSTCISKLIFSEDISDHDRLVGEFALCNAMLVKDKYITFAELETIAKDFNDIFEIEIENIIPIKADWLLDVTTHTNEKINNIIVNTETKYVREKNITIKNYGLTTVEFKSLTKEKDLIIITGQTSSSLFTKRNEKSKNSN